MTTTRPAPSGATAYRNGDVSFWMHGLGADRAVRESLPGRVDADVVIVGAGLSGMWAAYYLTELEPSARIVVVEANHVGFGASGRNGGWLSHLLPGNRARWAGGEHGLDGVVRLQRAMFDGIDEVLAVAAEHQIDMDQVRSGSVLFGTTEAALGRITAGRRADLHYGLTGDDTVVLDARGVAERIRVRGALGGVLHPGVVRIDPAKLVTALARLVESRGVRIYENTPATSVRPGAVATPHGTVDAEKVLLCVEGYRGSLLGSRRITPIKSSMIVTQPLSDDDWARIGWSGDELIKDAAHAFMYGQRTADGRIAIGGRGSPYDYGSGTGGLGVADPRTVALLVERLRRYFPDVAIDLAHAWAGVLGVTRDWCPSIDFRRDTGIGVTNGYAGHGVTTANVAARTLVDLAFGRATDLVSMPWVAHRSPRWEPEPLRWIGIHAMYRLFALADRWEDARRSTNTALLATVAGRIAGMPK